MTSSSSLAATASKQTQKPELKPKKYTLEQYLEREERAAHKHEFFNGQIQRMAGSNYKHNQIASNVVRHLGNAVEPLANRFIVLNSDQKIYLEAQNAAFYPDALVICEKPEFWKGREDLITNPLVIVEVASKSTRSFDRGEKFLSYQMIPSFREYVLIEQDKIWVETWFRQDAETWKTAVSTDLNGSIRLRALDVFLNLAEVYRHLSF